MRIKKIKNKKCRKLISNKSKMIKFLYKYKIKLIHFDSKHLKVYVKKIYILYNNGFQTRIYNR